MNIPFPVILIIAIFFMGFGAFIEYGAGAHNRKIVKEVNQLLVDCQKELPRNQYCRLVAISNENN